MCNNSTDLPDKTILIEHLVEKTHICVVPNHKRQREREKRERKEREKRETEKHHEGVNVVRVVVGVGILFVDPLYQKRESTVFSEW